MQIILGKIEKPEVYIDKAFARGKKKISMVKIADRETTKDQKYKHLESVRMNVVKDSLINDLQKIRRAFPMYNDLNEFYQEIFKCFIDFDMYKKSLGAVLWAENKIAHIFKIQNSQMKRKEKTNEIMTVRNVFLARLSSIMKQVQPNLEFLDKSRKNLKEIPNFKPNMFTVAIAGFPNVGKSTLLSKMTDSKPEINSYAFTTKGLMIGFLFDEVKKNKRKSKEFKDVINEVEDENAPKEFELEGIEIKSKKKKDDIIKIQMVDTPGTLNRDEKTNRIEKMAKLVLEKLSDLVVYVFDLTETSYPLADQLKLYRDLEKEKKKTIVYFSKSDLMDKSIIDKFEVDNEIPGYFDIDVVRKEILKNFVDKKEIKLDLTEEQRKMR
jgi:nucleolar GTP-binding protein